MSKKESTPRPWHTGPVTSAGSVWIYADCYPIAEPASFWNHIVNGGRRLLFKLRGDSANQHWKLTSDEKKAEYWKTVEANAALIVSAVNREPQYEKLLAEAKLYAPILEAAEQNPILWNALTAGTGIATTNGLRAAIAAIEEERDAK